MTRLALNANAAGHGGGTSNALSGGVPLVIQGGTESHSSTTHIRVLRFIIMRVQQFLRQPVSDTCCYCEQLITDQKH